MDESNSTLSLGLGDASENELQSCNHMHDNKKENLMSPVLQVKVNQTRVSQQILTYVVKFGIVIEVSVQTMPKLFRATIRKSNQLFKVFQFC